MQIVFSRPSILVVVFALLFGGVFNPLVGVAQDTEYFYSFKDAHLLPDIDSCLPPNPPCDPPARFQYAHDAAGEIIAFDSSYNATQGIFAFDMTLGGAINPAEMPKIFSVTIRPAAESDERTLIAGSDRGRYATIYFDVTDSTTPKISVYSFSGNEMDYDYLSYRGQFVGPQGTPCPAGASCYEASSGPFTNVYTLPDQICTTEDGDSCGVLSRVFTDNGDGTARYAFEINTSVINNYSVHPYNAHPKGWDGTQFDWEIGYLVSFLGYSNVEVSYGSTGYIETVEFDPVVDVFDDGGQQICWGGFYTCPKAYQTMIFGKDFQTAQPLYCDEITSSQSPIDVGEEFTASATAVSRTGQGLEITYLGAPVGSSLDPADGYVEPADPLNNPLYGEAGYEIYNKEEPIPTILTAGLSYTPTVDDLGQNFTIDMIFRDTFSDFEVTCPVNFEVQGAPLCAESNIFSLQIGLDSLADLQRKQVNRVTRRFVRLARGTSDFRKARRTRRRLMNQANVLYDLSWEYIWMDISSTINQCEDSPLCVEVSTVDKIVGYSENADQLFRLTQRANRRMRRTLNKGSRKIVRRAEEVRDISLNEVDNFPTSFSSCEAGIS